MAEISASLVKELREMTGLGMMECKKALAEAAGDLKKAEELLRIKSGAKAGKAAGRIAAEGVIGAYLSPDGRLGALVELNCETDFVAKNEDFLAFAKFLAELVATKDPSDVPALASISGIEEKRQGLVQKIGENITIRRFARIQANAKLAQYLHGTRIGVLVELDGPEEVGKDLAMHIAFAKPQYLARATFRPRSWRASATSRPRGRASPASRPRSWRKWSRAASTSSSARSPCSVSHSSRTTSSRSRRCLRRGRRSCSLPVPGRRRRHREGEGRFRGRSRGDDR